MSEKPKLQIVMDNDRMQAESEQTHRWVKVPTWVYWRGYSSVVPFSMWATESTVSSPPLMPQLQFKGLLLPILWQTFGRRSQQRFCSMDFWVNTALAMTGGSGTCNQKWTFPSSDNVGQPCCELVTHSSQWAIFFWRSLSSLHDEIIHNFLRIQLGFISSPTLISHFCSTEIQSYWIFHLFHWFHPEWAFPQNQCGDLHYIYITKGGLCSSNCCILFINHTYQPLSIIYPPSIPPSALSVLVNSIFMIPVHSAQLRKAIVPEVRRKETV